MVGWNGLLRRRTLESFQHLLRIKNETRLNIWSIPEGKPRQEAQPSAPSDAPE